MINNKYLSSQKKYFFIDFCSLQGDVTVWDYIVTDPTSFDYVIHCAIFAVKK